RRLRAAPQTERVNFRHRTFSRFWAHYYALPENVQRLAREQFDLLQQSPLHPSLRLKTAGPFWSVRVSLRYRALGIRHGDVFHWFWIGLHDEYERLLKDQSFRP